MKTSIKLIAFLLALLGVAMLSACSGKTAGDADESVVMEDGEDVGFEQAQVRIANMTGRDAIELLVRVSGGTWSSNVLTEPYFNTSTQLYITYNVEKDALYDLRFVFEDGTTRDFTKLDFTNEKAVFYLGGNDESTT